MLVIQPVLSANIPLDTYQDYRGTANLTAFKPLFDKYGSGKGKLRIYMPLSKLPPKDIVPPNDILRFLESQKLKIVSYTEGLCEMPDGRCKRIGSVLAKHPELKKMFDQDPNRQAQALTKYLVVISRRPHDILGMSFDREWSSCMNIDTNTGRKFLARDLKAGTLVAYLIKNSDKGIDTPLARIALRPYTNDKGEVAPVSGPVYGTAPPAFKHTVDVFLNKEFPHTGLFTIPDTLYADGIAQVYRNVAYKPPVNLSDVSANFSQPRISDKQAIETLKTLTRLNVPGTEILKFKVNRRTSKPNLDVLETILKNSPDFMPAVLSLVAGSLEEELFNVNVALLQPFLESALDYPNEGCTTLATSLYYEISEEVHADTPTKRAIVDWLLPYYAKKDNPTYFYVVLSHVATQPLSPKVSEYLLSTITSPAATRLNYYATLPILQVLVSSKNEDIIKSVVLTSKNAAPLIDTVLSPNLLSDDLLLYGLEHGHKEVANKLFAAIPESYRGLETFRDAYLRGKFKG